jgi:adenine-specific DNA-methyltransferase
MILENLKTAGVQQAHKEDRITFTRSTPGRAAGLRRRPLPGGRDKREARRHLHRPRVRHRAAQPTWSKPPASRRRRLRRADRLRLQLRGARHRVQQARPHPGAQGAHERRPAHGRGPQEHRQGQPVRDLRRARHQPAAERQADGKLRVKVNGVDVFKPQTGEVISDGADGIACWFIDTDYNEESFFVRHAYFLGANDPYSALKTTLKAEIDPGSLGQPEQRHLAPVREAEVGRIAVKVINHLGDEVMKVFSPIQNTHRIHLEKTSDSSARPKD